MAYEVICSFCRQRLEIAEGIREAELTCPSCLNKVANPGVGIRTTPPARGAAAATEASPLEQCPRCGKAVQGGWQYCPFCNAQLAVPSALQAYSHFVPPQIIVAATLLQIQLPRD